MGASLWVTSGFIQTLSPGNNGRGMVGTGISLNISDGFGNVSFVSLKIYEPGVLSHLSVHVPSNSMVSATASCTLHKNGSGTDLNFTIPAATTGYFSNTADSVPVAAGDTIYVRFNHGDVFDGGVDLNNLTVLFTPSDEDVTVTQTVTEQYSGFAGIAFGTVRYMGLHGQHGEGSASQSERQDCVPIACTARNARIGITANTTDGPVVCTLQKNGVDTAVTITFNAAESGFKENANDSVAFAAHDLAGWKIDTTGSSSGGITFINATCQFHSIEGAFFLGLGNQVRTPAGTTTDLSFGGDNYPLHSETQQQWAATDAGFLLGLCINITANVAGSDSALHYRKNGANGTSVVTIPASNTGFFDTEDTDTWSIDDLLTLRLTIPGGGEVSYSTIDIALSFEEPEDIGVIGPYAWVEAKRRIP